MADSRTLQILITAKNEASAQLSTINTKLKDLQPAFAKMAAAGAVAGGAMVLMGKNALTAASDFEETASKFGVVFSDVGDKAEEVAKDLQKNFGLSGLAAKQLLSNTGDLLTGFGIAGDKALQMSEDVNKLAVDLASFSNASGGAEAVSQALTKALLGERESLKTYGIAIQEADVQAELLAQGMSKLTGEALRQAKADVTLTLAVRQSQNAVGDFERTSESFANQQRILTARIEDLKVKLGNQLIPVMTKVLNAIVPVVEKVADWIEKNPELTKNIIIITGAIVALVAIVGTLGLALPVIITGFTLLLGPVGLVIAAIVALTAATVTLIKNWDNIKEYFQQTWDGIKIIFQESIDSIMAKMEPLFKMIDKVKSAASSVGSYVSDKFSFGGARASGGPVQSGKTFLVGEKGPELFTPSSSGNIIPNNKLSNGGGGVTVVVNGDVSGDELIEKVKTALVGQLFSNTKVGL